jgi:hypothetical protein
MKELRSRKTGNIHFVSDEEYEKLLGLGIERRYVVTDVEPVKQIKPPIEVVITKKKDNK